MSRLSRTATYLVVCILLIVRLGHAREHFGIELVVLGPGGKPVNRAIGLWWSDAGDGGDFVAGRHGARFEVGDHWPLELEVWGAESFKLTNLGPAHLELAEPPTEPVTVTLPEGAQIRGVLDVPDASDRMGIEVWARPTRWAEDPVMESLRQTRRAFALDAWHAWSRSDGVGAFLLTGLGEEEYVLEFEVPPGYDEPSEVHWRGGTKDELVVPLIRRDSPPVRIEVALSSGEVADGVVAEVRQERRHPGLRFPRPRPFLRRVTDPEGVVVFFGLDPTYEYELHLQPPDHLRKALPLDVLSWRPASGVFQLPPGHVLGGRVITPDGASVPGAVVELELGPAEERSAITDSQGHFAFGQLPDQLLLIVLDSRFSYSHVVTEPDVAGIVLVRSPLFDAGTTLQARLTGARLEGQTKGLRVHAARRGAPGARWAWRAVSNADGHTGGVEFRGLPRDEKLTLIAADWLRNQCWYAQDLVVGQPPVDVEARDGMAAAGRVVCPPNCVGLEVWTYPQEFPEVWIEGWCSDSSHKFRVGGLVPELHWMLVVKGIIERADGDADMTLSREVECQGDGDMTVHLPAR